MDYRIDVCCKGMGIMINDGTLTPYIGFGQETGQMNVRGKDGDIVSYNLVKYCPFCGRDNNNSSSNW